MAGTGLLRGRIVALAAVIAAVLATGTWFLVNRASAQPGSGGTRAHQAAARHSAPPPQPLRVVSVTPTWHARNVDGGRPVRVVFSAALAAGSPMPSLSPSIPGRWERAGSTATFVPKRGFLPETHVRLRVPAGPSGVKSAAGGQLAAPVSVRFRTGKFKTLRLDQLLAQLGYLPLTWTPDPSAAPVRSHSHRAQLSAAYRPPAGTFSWQSGYPTALADFWSPGRTNLIVHGAVIAFESDHGLTMDGVAGPQVWNALLRAAAEGQDNTHGYTYALARETSPETLTVWHDGHVVLQTLANTGIPVAPTTIGTAAVYLRYQNQIMRGTNPDGTKYADPVSWVAYFRAGEAIHYFPRGSYGFPQSLGCVELPYAQAEHVWPYLTFGTLVTVAAG